MNIRIELNPMADNGQIEIYEYNRSVKPAESFRVSASPETLLAKLPRDVKERVYDLALRMCQLIGRTRVAPSTTPGSDASSEPSSGN